MWNLCVWVCMHIYLIRSLEYIALHINYIHINLRVQKCKEHANEISFDIFTFYCSGYSNNSTQKWNAIQCVLFLKKRFRNVLCYISYEKRHCCGCHGVLLFLPHPTPPVTPSLQSFCWKLEVHCGSSLSFASSWKMTSEALILWRFFQGQKSAWLCSWPKILFLGFPRVTVLNLVTQRWEKSGSFNKNVIRLKTKQDPMWALL